MANELYKNFPEIQYTLSNGKIVTIKDFFRKAKLETSQLNDLIDYTWYEIQEGERPDVIASKLYGNGDLHWTLFLANEISNYYDWHMDTPTFEKYLSQKYRGQVLVSSVTTDIVSGGDYPMKFLIGEDITQGNAVGKVLKVDPTYYRIWVETTNGNKFVANQEVTGSTDWVINQAGDLDKKKFTPTSVANGIDGLSYYYDPDAIDKGLRYNNNTTGTYMPRSYYEDEYEKNEERRKIKVIRPEFIRRVVSEFERIMSA